MISAGLWDGYDVKIPHETSSCVVNLENKALENQWPLMIIDEFSDLVKISLVDKIVAALGSEIDLDNDNDQHKGHPQGCHH